jgi:hypothetical protein
MFRAPSARLRSLDRQGRAGHAKPDWGATAAGGGYTPSVPEAGRKESALVKPSLHEVGPGILT